MIISTKSSGKIRRGTEYRDNKLPARLLSVSEVAHFLGVHSSTIRRWEKRGLLKSYPIGLRHNLRFKQEDVLIFLNKCQRGNTHRVSQNDDIAKERHKIKPDKRRVRWKR